MKSQLSQAPHDRNIMKIRTKNKVETRQKRRKIMSGKPQGAQLLATIQKARQRQGKKKKHEELNSSWEPQQQDKDRKKKKKTNKQSKARSLRSWLLVPQKYGKQTKRL
jgi:hypothetical protein